MVNNADARLKLRKGSTTVCQLAIAHQHQYTIGCSGTVELDAGEEAFVAVEKGSGSIVEAIFSGFLISTAVN